MSDTTLRDRLGLTISAYRRNAEVAWDEDLRLADHLLNLGWRPPARVVSTWEEVQSLKEGALLAIERWGHMRVYERQEDDAWCLSGGGWLDEDWLPATVMWEPEEGE